MDYKGDPLDEAFLAAGGVIDVGGPSNTGDAAFKHQTESDIWTVGIDSSDTPDGTRPYKIARGANISVNERVEIAPNGQLTLPFYTVPGDVLTVGAGGVISEVTPAAAQDLQSVYDNVTSQPEILTDTTRNAVSIQRGTAADTDNVLEILNGAGTVTCAIDGNGTVNGTGMAINGNPVIKTVDTEGWSSDAETSAVVIISLRRVKQTYTGPCVNVRRSSDDTNQDIYFDPETNALNKDAFDYFIGGGNGFCEIIYDQSGNGNNFTNTTHSQQPQILFETLGGNQIPYLSWTQDANALQCVNDTDSMSLTSNDYWYSVVIKTSSTGIRFLAASSVSGHYELQLGAANDNIRSIPNNTVDYSDITITSQNWTDNAVHTLLLRQQGSLYVAVGSGLTSDCRYDGTLYSPSDEDFQNSSTNAFLRLGSRPTVGSFGYGGRMNEFIVYSSAPTNISLLETDQSNFWTSGINPGIYSSISTIDVASTNIEIDKPLYISSIFENNEQGSLIKTTRGLSGNNYNIGTTSLNSLSNTSFGNIGIGNSSGKNISSGDENICLGDYSGDTITTGSNNVMVGRITDGIAGGNNQIAIGDSAVCDASNQCTVGDANLTVIRAGANNVCDLGQAARQFKDVYLGGVAKSDGSGVNYFLGNTSIGITANFAKLFVFNDLGATGTGILIENDSSGSGTIAAAYGVSVRTDTNSGTATITDNFNIIVNSPTTSAGNAIGNNFGLYIADMDTSQVTTPYGIRQVGGTNLNRLDGYTAINAAPSSSYNLLVGGGYYNGSGTTWTAVSDSRVKENIVDKNTETCLQNINNIRVRNFNYTDEYIKSNNKLDKSLQTGIVAQEIEPVLPSCVKTIPRHKFEYTDEGEKVETSIADLKTFNIDSVIYDLIGAIQVLTRRVERLENA